MKVLARAKMPKTSQRDFLVAHRYTICDGMCALRGVLQTAHSSLRTKRQCPRIAKTLSENKAEASLKIMKNEYEIEKECSFSTVIFDKILICVIKYNLDIIPHTC